MLRLAFMFLMQMLFSPVVFSVTLVSDSTSFIILKNWGGGVKNSKLYIFPFYVSRV